MKYNLFSIFSMVSLTVEARVGARVTEHGRERKAVRAGVQHARAKVFGGVSHGAAVHGVRDDHHFLARGKEEGQCTPTIR